MGKQKHRKNDSSSELEGLRTEDGSQPSLKGIKIVEYNRKHPETRAFMMTKRISPRYSDRRLLEQKRTEHDEISKRRKEVESQKKESAVRKGISKKGEK